MTAINDFKEDLKELMRCHYNVNKAYGVGQDDFSQLKKRFEILLKAFNEKYPGLMFKVQHTADEYALRIFIKKDKKILDIFMNIASKITGIRSAGLNDFNEVDVARGEQFSKLIQSAKKKLFLTYSTEEEGTQTIYLECDPKAKKVELIYNPDEITEDNIEFRLISFYAIQNYKPKINLMNLSSKIGMADLLVYDERKRFLDKFEPPFLE